MSKLKQEATKALELAYEQEEKVLILLYPESD